MNVSKTLIIIGSAPCVQEDIIAFATSFIPWAERSDYMLIGLDSVDKYLGRAKYFTTYHPADIAAALKRRTEAGGNTDWIIVSQEQNGMIDIVIPLLSGPSGSSSLCGVHAGMKEGYKKIILCGCPLIGKNAANDNYEVYQQGWLAKYKEIKECVRSMSGWTREFLGAPTLEWLNS